MPPDQPPDPRRLPVAVLAGGMSPERMVSFASGKAVCAALERRGVSCVLVDPAERALSALRPDTACCALVMLHGAPGEGGAAQAYLAGAGVPYTGCSAAVSALAFDKARTKAVWRRHGLPTPDWRPLRSAEDCAAAAAELGLPLFVKPARGGSSVGVAKAFSASQVEEAWHRVLRQTPHGPVLAERFVDGAGCEYTVGVLDGVPLPVVGIEPAGDFFDYAAKYKNSDTRYFCPSGLPAELEAELKALAGQAYHSLGCEGCCRVDAVVDVHHRQPYLLEINTVPGMSPRSLLPLGAAAAGIEFDDLVLRILSGAHL